MESLPAEVLFGIVNYLDRWEAKNLSRVSRRMRDICLPFIFRNFSIHFSNEGFILLEELVKSNLHRHVVSFEYVVPKLLKTEVLNYPVFKRDILTPQRYVDTCECYDDVDSPEAWDDEFGYSSGGHPSYTRVYKTIRRICEVQQEIIETGRDSNSMKLAFQQLHNLKEITLAFCDSQGDEDWLREYQELFCMTEDNSYEYHIQIVLDSLASVTNHSLHLREVQLSNLTLFKGPLPTYMTGWNWADTVAGGLQWNSLRILLTELVRNAPSLRLVQSDLALALLSGESLNICDLDLCSIDMELAFIKSFLGSNAKSLRSLSVQEITITERNQRDSIPLIPLHLFDVTGLTIENKQKFDNPLSLNSCREGWKMLFTHDTFVSASKDRKTERTASLDD